MKTVRERILERMTEERVESWKDLSIKTNIGQEKIRMYMSGKRLSDKHCMIQLCNFFDIDPLEYEGDLWVGKDENFHALFPKLLAERITVVLRRLGKRLGIQGKYARDELEQEFHNVTLDLLLWFRRTQGTRYHNWGANE